MNFVIVVFLEELGDMEGLYAGKTHVRYLQALTRSSPQCNPS
jgi:hypothetical protein